MPKPKLTWYWKRHGKLFAEGSVEQVQAGSCVAEIAQFPSIKFPRPAGGDKLELVIRCDQHQARWRTVPRDEAERITREWFSRWPLMEKDRERLVKLDEIQAKRKLKKHERQELELLMSRPYK